MVKQNIMVGTGIVMIHPQKKEMLMILRILVGVGIYLGLSIVTHNKEMAFVINKVKKVRSGTKNT